MFTWGRQTNADIQVPPPANLSTIAESIPTPADDILAAFNALQTPLQQLRQQLDAYVLGQANAVQLLLITLLSGGHALLVGVPGVAKTRLAFGLSQLLGLSNKRVQATPDLLPGDILGGEILDINPDGTRAFRFIEGPVFSQLLLVDEINRANPRTQAALLQAMQEGQVTVNGVDYPLPQPFTVLATQNPLEYEGTYPLPEAQLDRFLMQIDVPLPGRQAERQMLVLTTGTAEAPLENHLTALQLQGAQNILRQLPYGTAFLDVLLDIVRALRPTQTEFSEVERYVQWGPGPRAGQALLQAARARAMLEGRIAPDLSDLRAIAVPVLQHRMALTPTARVDGMDVKQVIDVVCQQLLP